jgi:Tfp pilus assembly protein FimV
LTHDIRPIFLASVLALGLTAAPNSQAANLVNLEGLKSSFTYTPMAGESLDKIIAKTMPNSQVKPELVAEAFKALNPEQFSKDQNNVTKSAAALKVPNQNQLANLIEMQLGKKQPQNLLSGAAPVAPVAPIAPIAPSAPLAPKVNPKTESWVRFPAKVVALTQKMESWIRYPGGNYSEVNASAESKSWVRYPSANSQSLAISTSTQTDQSEWVRYVAKN